jgi:predicted ATP-grasp superfamily ATP-dependent carboligase
MAPGTRLHVLSHTPDVPVRWSRHKATFHHERIDDDEAWLAAIERLAAQGIDVLLAVAEPGMRLLAKHRSRLEGLAAVAPGPSVDAFDIAVNKARYTALLEERGFLVPRTVNVRASEIADGTFGEQIAGENAFIVQEIVSGRDICCVVLCEAGKPVAYSTYHAIASGKRFSPWSCSNFNVDEQVVAKTAEITSLLEWSGPANVDFIRSAEGELWSLEFNGRYDGSVLSSAQAGVNFPRLHLELGQGRPVGQPAFESGVYLDHRGVVEQLWARVRRRPHVAFGYGQTYLPVIAQDPLPEVSMAVRSLRSLMPG